MFAIAFGITPNVLSLVGSLTLLDQNSMRKVFQINEEFFVATLTWAYDQACDKTNRNKSKTMLTYHISQRKQNILPTLVRNVCELKERILKTFKLHSHFRTSNP